MAVGFYIGVALRWDNGVNRQSCIDDLAGSVAPQIPRRASVSRRDHAAEGGGQHFVVHADAKLAAREALAGVPDGHIEIVALATETPQALFLAGTYRGASARLTALTWGAEDLSAELGAEANRDADGRWLEPYCFARTLCLAGAAAAEVQAIDTVFVDFRNDAGIARECEEARRD